MLLLLEVVVVVVGGSVLLPAFAASFAPLGVLVG